MSYSVTLSMCVLTALAYFFYDIFMPHALVNVLQQGLREYFFTFLLYFKCVLRTPAEERLPSGAPKEEFGRMVFQKKSSLGDRTKFGSKTSAGAHGGTRTCDAPCILGRVLDSAFIQARVRRSCSGVLIYKGRHTFRCHASPPRAATAQL